MEINRVLFHTPFTSEIIPPTFIERHVKINISITIMSTLVLNPNLVATRNSIKLTLSALSRIR